eukprot:6180558-Pleurochrysis_carterae.AAC.2
MAYSDDLCFSLTYSCKDKIGGRSLWQYGRRRIKLLWNQVRERWTPAVVPRALASSAWGGAAQHARVCSEERAVRPPFPDSQLASPGSARQRTRE